MIKFVPLKYVLGMIALFNIIPISLILIIIFAIGLSDLTVAICMFLGFLVIIGPFVYLKNQVSMTI